MQIITLTTDFGESSPYVAAMKGAIYCIAPEALVVDLTHIVPAQDIREGALTLYETARWFPPGTIHVVVVDPGVGTDRAILYAEIGGQRYIAPDNGLLSFLMTEEPLERAFTLEASEYWHSAVSKTFHGRDIMGPAAAHLANGLNPEKLGPPPQDLVTLDWHQPNEEENRISGRVMKFDSFGNIITNIHAKLLGGRPTDPRACVACNIYETNGIYGSYAEEPFGTFIAVIGSNGFLELAIVGENAAERLGVRIGDPVNIVWESHA